MKPSSRHYKKSIINCITPETILLYIAANVINLFILAGIKDIKLGGILHVPLNGAIETTFKCYELYNDTHCEYHNIYFDGQSFYAHTNKYQKIKPVMINALNFTPYWKPKLLNNHNLEKGNLRTRKGISFMVEIPYACNIGHLLFDVMHPLFLKLLMLKLPNYQAFDLYINKKNYVEQGIFHREFPQKFKNICINFSKGIMYVLDPKPPKLREMIIIEHLYAGVGRHGLRYINKNFNIPAAIEYNSIQQFRDRFFNIYNISIPMKRNRILFVNNKRFAIYRSQLKSLAFTFSKTFPQYISQYVSYSNIAFRDQLMLLSETILYVTAPGTSMLNFIFLNDRAFMYITGDVNKHRKDRYLDESMVESFPYVQPFYYFDNNYSQPYNFTKIHDELYDIVNHHVIPDNFSRDSKEKGSGLSILGKKFVYYCGLFPNSCDSYLRSVYSMRDNGYICSEACSWGEPILMNYCKFTNFCKFKVELPFICYHNYTCEIINPKAS